MESEPPSTGPTPDEAPEPSSEFVGPEHESLDLRKEGEELERELEKLTDPATALRFREGLARRLHDQGKRLPSQTKSLFKTWGIDGPYSPDQHAVASFLGVTDEQWDAQCRSLDPAADGVEFVPVKYVKAFDSLVRENDRDLLLMVKNQHAGEPADDYKKAIDYAKEPMKVVTEHDRYMSMPTEQLDLEIRTASPMEQANLINTYLLPRVDEQERWLHTDEAKADEDESDTARAIIADIEARLRDMGITRMDVAGTKYDRKSHAIVSTIGSGPYWIVATELRAGYRVGKSTLRPAAVNVIRMTQAQYDAYTREREEEKAKAAEEKRRKAKKVGRVSLAKSTETEASTDPKPDDTESEK